VKALAIKEKHFGQKDPNISINFWNIAAEIEKDFNFKVGV